MLLGYDAEKICMKVRCEMSQTNEQAVNEKEQILRAQSRMLVDQLRTLTLIRGQILLDGGFSVEMQKKAVEHLIGATEVMRDELANIEMKLRFLER